MKIICKAFQDYRDVIAMCTGKGDTYSESTYLDFDNGYAYMQSHRGLSRLKFEFAKDDVEVPNFYVNTKKFLMLIASYPVLSVNPDFSFSNPNDDREIFRIETLEEGFDKHTVFPAPPFSGYENISLSEYTLSLVAEAQSFIQDEISAMFNGIFMSKDRVIAACSTGFYEAEIDDIVSSDLKIHRDTLQVLTALAVKGEPVSILSNGRVQIIAAGDKFNLATGKDVSLIVPPYNDESFIAEYNTESYLIINTKELLDAVAFLDSFAKDLKNDRLFFSVDGNDLTIEIVDRDKIRRVINAEEVVGLEGIDRQLPLGRFRTSCRMFRSDLLKIQLSEESATVNLTSVQDETDEEGLKHIVIPKLESV